MSCGSPSTPGSSPAPSGAARGTSPSSRRTGRWWRSTSPPGSCRDGGAVVEIVLRATVIFAFLWLLTRAMGKRELAEMTAFELLLLVVVGDLIQQGATQEDMSLTGAMLAVGTIAL